MAYFSTVATGRVLNRRQQMRDFIRQTPWFMGDVDGDVHNWTPEEDEAWSQFTADIVARHKAERHELAVEMGYYPRSN